MNNNEDGKQKSHFPSVVLRRELEPLRRERATFGDAYKRFLKSHALEDVGIDDQFFIAARYTEAGRKVTL